MTDMLVKLYDVEDDWSFLADQAKRGIAVRKPIGAEKHLIVDWIREHFSDAWASEMDMAMSNRPISSFVAIQEGTLIGFACYDATVLGFFGPTGVHELFRSRGIGRALMLACLLDMKLKGYGYAIIGGAGPTEFYRRIAGGVEIPDSEQSVWKDWLRRGVRE